MSGVFWLFCLIFFFLVGWLVFSLNIHFDLDIKLVLMLIFDKINCTSSALSCSAFPSTPWAVTCSWAGKPCKDAVTQLLFSV